MPQQVVRFDDEVGQFDVRLSWEPEKYVQLGIETNDGRSLLDWLSGDGTSEDEAARFAGLFGTLNRPSINRLIRLLRTARDDVFGSDQ